MVDTNTVCAMCGDVGFPEKLFQCTRCHYRSQHSYCTNYYGDDRSDATSGVCDWCLSEDRSAAAKQHGGQAKKSSGDKSKQSSTDRDETGGRGKSGGGASSSSSTKATSRRYKLLKDVLC